MPERNSESYLKSELRTSNFEGLDSCAPAQLKLGRVPASSPLPSRLCLLCRFSQKLHSTSRFAHLCLARRSLGEGGSLASPRLRSPAAAGKLSEDLSPTTRSAARPLGDRV